MTIEDPSCFPWWQEFSDSVLNELIEDNLNVLCSLEIANQTAADIARSYIQLRGLQERLEVQEKQISAWHTTLNLNQDLANTGFTSTLNQNESEAALFNLLSQKTELQLAIDRAIFHLSTLTSEPLDCLYKRLAPKPLFHLPCYLPIGTPCDIEQNHPTIADAAKAYCKSKSRLAFYNYQKQVFTVFEKVEGALAALKSQQEAFCFFENIKDLKAENYQLIKDLNQQGLKSDSELQAVYLELLSAEDALIQAKVKLLVEYVNLYEAQGGGFCTF